MIKSKKIYEKDAKDRHLISCEKEMEAFSFKIIEQEMFQFCCPCLILIRWDLRCGQQNTKIIKLKKNKTGFKNKASHLKRGGGGIVLTSQFSIFL